MTSEEALKRLKGAIANLSADQGRVARKNARAKIARCLRALRSAVDEEFPPIVKTREIKRHKKRGPPDTFLRNAGWAPVPANYRTRIVEACAAAGVRVRIVGPLRSPWVRAWVLSVEPGNVSKLKETKRSTAKQRALMSTALLKGGTP